MAFRAVNKVMKLCVVSRNLKLFDLCSDVARGLSLFQCEVVRVDPDQHYDEPSDLLIWDLDDVDWAHRDSRSIPQRPSQAQVFVIGRKQVGEFLRTLPLGAGSTLLKPVNRAALQIFVEQAAVQASKHSAQQSAQLADESFTPQDDRPDLLQCLLTANLKLQEYDQDRTNFLARAVHDFRAPLMAASGYCGLLLEGALGSLNGDQLESLQRMQHSLKKLTRMASAMFQLSVGKQVEKRLELKPGSVETCIHHAAHEIAPLAAERKVSIAMKLTAPDAPLFLDPEQIEQVLVNLLENACKFTPKGGQIEIRAYPISAATHFNGAPSARHLEPDVQEGYRVDISDTGTGILPEHLEAVFEEYTSYSGSQDRSGGGLGLAICKMIVTEHGGYVWAENHSAGARISFVLPVGHPGGRKRTEVRAESVAKRAAS